MIIIDTNVLSELTRPEPSPMVLMRLRAVPSGSIYTTSVCRAETLFGLKLLPDGRRKDDLMRRTELLFANLLKDRILPFDDAAATYYPEIVLARRKTGRPISMADAMIAAICLSTSLTLATRNVRDFEDTGASIVNPFEDVP